MAAQDLLMPHRLGRSREEAAMGQGTFTVSPGAQDASRDKATKTHPQGAYILVGGQRPLRPNQMGWFVK